MDNNQTNNMNQDVNTQINENLNQQPTVAQPEAPIASTEPVQEEKQVLEQPAVQPQNPVAPQPETQPQQVPDVTQQQIYQQQMYQQQMYQQQMPGAQQPKKKFNWVLWIAVALIVPITIGLILQMIGSNMVNSGPDAVPVGNFIKALGNLAMFLLTVPSVIIVVIIGAMKSNKN